MWWLDRCFIVPKGKFDLTSVTFFMHSALRTENKELSYLRCMMESRHLFPAFLESSALPRTQKIWRLSFVIFFLEDEVDSSWNQSAFSHLCGSRVRGAILLSPFRFYQVFASAFSESGKLTATDVSGASKINCKPARQSWSQSMEDERHRAGRRFCLDQRRVQLCPPSLDQKNVSVWRVSCVCCTATRSVSSTVTSGTPGEFSTGQMFVLHSVVLPAASLLMSQTAQRFLLSSVPLQMQSWPASTQLLTRFCRELRM